jgi:catechol 2,3-dioxygenase-like lactoylglutathione lyase family enzyme
MKLELGAFNMRLDHIAYRVKDRHKTAKFFKNAFGYQTGTEFRIEFDDGSKADCLALTPPEDRHFSTMEWNVMLADRPEENEDVEFHAYHAPPEIFVSDGTKGSIVGDWVAERGGVGGIHHIAYQVEDVEGIMNEWKEKGYAEFYSEKPITCKDPNLTQVFTKPSELTGVIYEFINREGAGFCKDSVKQLMESTRR